MIDVIEEIKEKFHCSTAEGKRYAKKVLNKLVYHKELYKIEIEFSSMCEDMDKFVHFLNPIVVTPTFACYYITEPSIIVLVYWNENKAEFYTKDLNEFSEFLRSKLDKAKIYNYSRITEALLWKIKEKIDEEKSEPLARLLV